MRLLRFVVGAGLVLAACSSEGVVTTTTATPAEPSSAPTTTTAPAQQGEPDDLMRDQDIPTHLATMAAIWPTDFSVATIDLEELLVGIPTSDPRDMIPPIDGPRFAAASETEWIGDNEPGVLVSLESDSRFYPLSVLTRHEIVNDEIGGIPVAVTYCPLCNTALAFDRRYEGDVLRLGVSGLLRNSDLVMWDNQTGTLWQQITGEAIVGERAGARLTVIPSAIVRWLDFREEHPDGLALTNDQGFGTGYGRNPYEFYSSRETPYGFFTGEIDPTLPALERVVGVELDGENKAFPFSTLSTEAVVNDEVAGQPVVVLWGSPDTADALDSGSIADARGIGTAVAYDPVVDGRLLTFVSDGDVFRDLETDSTWNVLGVAVQGELQGVTLDLVPHRNEFWFAWQAFFPEGKVCGAA